MSHCHDCSTAAPATECGHLCELSLLNIILSVFSHNTVITVDNIVSSVETTGQEMCRAVSTLNIINITTPCPPPLQLHTSAAQLAIAAEVITHHHFASPSL